MSNKVLSAADDAKLLQVVAETLGVKRQDLTEDASPETLSAWTSLSHLSLMSAVEDAFGAAFSMEEMGTAGKSLAHLRQLLATHSAE